ncbi:MAG: phosphate ABC transporter permease PstA [Verrucomicrobia bacterium]|nr:phosphate ABC transporter permease PstA [Verrucomicrobiota bacterium]
MSAGKHIFQSPASGFRRAERAWLWAFRLATYLVLACGLGVFATIVVKGSRTVFQTEAPFLNVRFLTQAPESLYVFDFEGRHYEQGDREHRAFVAAHPAAENVKKESLVYSAGGIFPCIVGTLLLVVGSMSIALFLGVAAAIYLNEYARDGWFIRFVRLAILNLAGVPSIVFGLFGFGLFVIFFGWNVSLLAGWFTLAFMVLPVVITASEESLKAVPKGFREGSLALGATKWQAISTNVLPYALPGILTSSILGVARVAGETAPIMFTAAYVVRDKLPWEVARAGDFFFQGVMALPYHIYVVSSKIPQNDYTERVQYGSAFVFLLLVALIATTSILLRNHLRNRYKW